MSTRRPALLRLLLALLRRLWAALFAPAATSPATRPRTLALGRAVQELAGPCFHDPGLW